MRNRILQKSFWTSSEIIELEIHERLLFLGMTNHADDEGIIKTAPRALKAKIFPADNMSVEKIENALFKMRELGLIIFNEDATLCRFVNWFEFQKINRPYPSKFNFVEEKKSDSVNIHGTFSEHSLPNNNNNSNNKKKKNNKNKTNKSVFSNEFESFWKTYPRKVAKKKCYDKFNSLLIDFKLEEIIEGSSLWIQYWKTAKTRNEYIPHPYTFLNQERFIDIPDELQGDYELEFRLDTSGNFFIGYCAGCNESSFYRKEELTRDSRCCGKNINPEREMVRIQEVNAKA
tara:strand:+ start:4651 stop:5514 length:864 start_codon:yes stop_codon:yes gene_type:complete